MNMNELKARITEGLKTIQLANLATITADGLPWTRYVMIAGDDELWTPPGMEPEALGIG